MDRNGRVVFNHERSDSWNINHHLQSMQKQEGLTVRDIYWRLWGLVNWLRCDHCHCNFQCSELPLCAHHPQPVMVTPSYSGEHLSTSLHSCCRRPVLGYSTLPHVQVLLHVLDSELHLSRITTNDLCSILCVKFEWITEHLLILQDGCAFRDHVIVTDSTHKPASAGRGVAHSEQVYAILLRLRDTICTETLRAVANSDDSSRKKYVGVTSHLQQAQYEVCFLQNEEREPRLPPSSSGEVPITQSSHRDVSKAPSSESVQSSSSSRAVNSPTRHSLTQRASLHTRQSPHDSHQQSHDLMELEEDDEDERPQVLYQHPRPRRGRHVRNHNPFSI